MVDLAAQIEANRDAIVRRFVAVVRSELGMADRDELQLENALPALLDALANTLGAGARAERGAYRLLAREHGEQRRGIGFDLGLVVRELGVLRTCIVDVVEESAGELPRTALRRLSRLVDEAMIEAAQAYVLLRDELASRDRRRESAQLETMFDVAPVGIAVMSGPEHRFELANPLYLHIAGRPVIGRTVAEAFPDLRGQGFFELLDEVYRTGQPASAREMYASFAYPGGAEGSRWLDFSYQARRDADGQIDGIVAHVVDVTEQVRARRLAEREAAELHAVLDSIGDAVYVGDATGIKRANRAALDQLGFDSVEELGAQDIAETAARIRTRRSDTLEVLSGEEQAFTRALRGRADVQEVVVRHLRTGEDRVVRSSCAPIRVGDEVAGAVAVNTDITEERRRSEFERHLIGIVSHDLRNPLNVVLLGAQSLVARRELDAAVHKTANRIHRAAKTAIGLIHDLLDFTQARLGGGLPVERQQGDLWPTVRETIEEVELANPGRRFSVELLGDSRGSWDPGRIGQLVSNLLINALKYSPADTEVRVVGRSDRNGVTFCVHNRGDPIPPERMPLLFRPMQRVQGDAAHRSVGLGLFIVKQICDAHGGTIEVSSSPEEGTTFTVGLPREPRPAPV